MGIPQKNFSFIIAVAVVVFMVHGYEIDDCLDKLYADDTAKCPDYDLVIACLQKAKNEPSVKGTYMELATESSILYFQKSKSDDACPALSAKESCVEHEMEVCNKLKDMELDTNDEMCKEMTATIDCLKKLKSNCSSSNRIDSELRNYEEIKQACDSQLRERQTDDKCFHDIEVCVSQVYDLMNKRDFAEACKKVGLSIACLNSLPAKCVQDLDYLKKDMSDTVADCVSGIFTGKCSYMAIEKCVVPVYGAIDEMFGEPWDREDTSNSDSTQQDPCNPANFETAKQCLADLKPSCAFPKQIEYYNYTIQEMNEMCPQ